MDVTTPAIEPVGYVPSLFVVGDVHLHARARPDVALDLARWVELVTRTNPKATVVFNGDLFDLDRVTGEASYGLGPDGAKERLKRILAQADKWVQATKRHLAGGGRVVFVAGNHDAELLLTGVKQLIFSLFSHSRDDVEVTERFELGNLLVHHGHQVDPDARFFPDTASAVAKRRLSAFPLACVITRVLLSRIPRFELTDDNHRKPVHVFTRVLRDYRLGAVRMIILFPLSAIEVVVHSLLARWREDVPRGGDASSMSSPMTVASRLYVDRYVATAVVLACAVVWLFAGGRALGWTTFGLGAYLMVPPARLKKFARRDVRRCDEQAAQLIEDGKHAVICGHVHRAFVREMPGGRVYANHGAFSVQRRFEEVVDELHGTGRLAGAVDGSGPVRTFLSVSFDSGEPRVRLEAMAGEG